MPLEHINLAPGRRNAPAAASQGADAGSEKFMATPEELRVIEEKMKDPKFAELMHDYMKSLEDPETRREEEAYLEQAEREAREGGDFSFEFVFPRPAFVVELLEPSHATATPAELAKLGISLSTSSTRTSKKRITLRSFLNFCTSEKVKEFTERTTGDASGSNWEVPVCVSQRRLEVYQPVKRSSSSSIPVEYAAAGDDGAASSNSVACVVHDVVFHPSTLALSDRSVRFMTFLTEIAVEHINSGYGEANSFPYRRVPSCIVSIGTPQNQTIRSSKTGGSPFDVDPNAPVLTRPTKHLPTSVASKPASSSSPAAATSTRCADAVMHRTNDSAASTPPAPTPRLPPHTITHRGSIDLSDAWQWRVSDKRVGVPEELIVKMTFAEVQRASALDIAIVPNGHALRIDPTEGQSRYEGLLVLPFSVEEVPRHAQFDRARGVLTLTLKVVPPPLPDGAPTAEELRERWQGGAAEQRNQPSTPEVEPSQPPPPSVKQTCSESASSERESTAPPRAAEEPAEGEDPQLEPPARVVMPDAVAPVAATTPHGPALEHIGDQDRVKAMMAQVRAAKMAREAAAAASASDEKKNGSDAPPAAAPVLSPVGRGDEARASTTTIAMVSGAAEPSPLVLHSDDTKPSGREAVMAQKVSDPEPISLTGKAATTAEPSLFTVQTNADGDGVAALHARQQAWAAMIEAELQAAKALEEKEAARAARETELQAAKARRRIAADKENERLAQLAHAKRAELPLANAHIFAID